MFVILVFWGDRERWVPRACQLASLAYLLTSGQPVKDPFQKTKVEAGGMVQQIKVFGAKPKFKLQDPFDRRKEQTPEC